MTSTVFQPAQPPATSTTNPATGVTVEHLLFGAVLAIAAGMCFIGLASAPLTPAEAAHAWAALQAATAAPIAAAPAPASALLYGMDALLFFLLGATDFLARLAPALAGVATVALPWFWRSQLGRVAALLTALLFAVDPWLVALSRQAGGGALALFLGLLALTALWRWQDDGAATPARRWERTLAVSAGLLFTAGALAWSFLPVLALAVALELWGAQGERVRWERSTFFWFLGALIIGATGLLTRPEAVAAVGASLSAWLCQVTGCDGAAQSWWWPIVRLWVDQPFLAVFGLLGIVALWIPRRVAQRRRSLAILLTLWVIWGGVLCLLPGRGPAALVILVLPLMLAAALLLARLLEIRLDDVMWLEIAIVLVVETVLVVASAIWLTSLVDSAAYDQQLLLTGAILAGLAVLVWVGFGFWAGWRQTIKVAGLFFAGLLCLMTVRSSWLLNHSTGLMHPDGFWPAATNPAVRMLADDVQRLSSMRRGDPHVAMVQVITATAPDPVLGWYLRNMSDVRWLLAPQPDAAPATPPLPGANPAALTPLVITRQGGEAWAENPALAGYLGSSYGLYWRWDLAQLPALPPVEGTAAAGLDSQPLAELRAQQAWPQETRPRLEWLFYRKVNTAPPQELVDLWAMPLE